GLGTGEYPAGVSADLAIDRREVGCIADQAAGGGVLAELVDRRNGIACRQCHDLLAAAGKERVAADEQSAGMPLHEGGEGGIYLAFGAGRKDIELHPPRARRFLGFLDYGLGIR